MNPNNEILEKICKLISQKDDISETEKVFKNRVLNLLEKDGISKKIKNFSNIIKYILKENSLFLLPSNKTIKARIYFVRHGKTEGKNDSMPKSTNIRLDDIGITQMEKVGEILKKIGLNKNNSKIMWSEDTFRTDQSKDILTLYIGNKNLKKTGLLRSIKNDDIKLKDGTIGYTFKKGELGLIEVMDVSKDTLTCILQEKNKINDGSQIKNIVLVGHSSNKGVIEEVGVKHKKGEVLIDGKGFPTGGVIEIDINFNGDLINQADNKNILKLNIGNYEEIINILESKIQEDSYLDLLIKLQINRFK
ncbi:phosphoglycerate mutase family protein, partial [Candidatus Gracilibacteria bacterium]|nr:phosphoglycerate mutase family protein [Candidatus Gracilibacteria bacterium]